MAASGPSPSGGTATPRGRLRACILLVLACYLVAVLVVEAVARARWTAPWYERLVTEQARSGNLPYRKNSWNLRDREYAVPRPEGVHRVLILGASCVMGSGVRNVEEVFAERLERSLNEHPWPGAPDGIEVLNGGVPGSFTRSWLWQWRQIGAQFDPDLLLIVFFLRDGTSTGTERGFFDVVREEYAGRDRDSLLYRHSYLFRTLRDHLDRRRISERTTQAFHDAYFGGGEATENWRQAQENLRELCTLAREHGTRVAFSVLPILVELEEDYPFQREVDLFTGFGHELGLAAHDLTSAFRGEAAPDLWVSPLDQHPNARAHGLIAADLTPFVTRELQSAVAHQSR